MVTRKLPALGPLGPPSQPKTTISRNQSGLRRAAVLVIDFLGSELLMQGSVLAFCTAARCSGPPQAGETDICRSLYPAL
jgi:hypothetical protein